MNQTMVRDITRVCSRSRTLQRADRALRDAATRGDETLCEE